MICVFRLITSLEFDDSPISYCLKQPYAVESFPKFVAFVDSVLQKHRSQHLTRFRLGVGPHLAIPYRWSSKHESELCELGCFPDLKSTKINEWICSSLARCGLRELDLRICVREEGDAQLPPLIFTCETLVVLKLEVNLGLDQVSTMPSFCLPNLKLAVFAVAIIPDDGLLTRFVSSCTLLEDLTVEARLKDARFLRISSPSLQRLRLLSLMRPLSNVQHLALNGDCMEDLYHDSVINQLPCFHNLNILELDGVGYWDKVLLAFLNCSPVLETLIFPEGLDEPCVLDQEFSSTTLPNVPSCCNYHLKKVVIKHYRGNEREIDLIQFLLRHALVLEELVIFRCDSAVSDPTALESTLQNLPRASITSSIQVMLEEAA